MPIYHKKDGQWILAASLYREPNSSLYKNDGGEWKDINSAWIKKNGKWQQIFQKSSWKKNIGRGVIFLGDDVSWGWGLNENRQFPYIIQDHLYGVIEDAFAIGLIHGAGHCFTSDDCVGTPFGGGYNGTQKLTLSSGVRFVEEGPFKNFKGIKTSSYRPPMIQIPADQFIEASFASGVNYINFSASPINSTPFIGKITLLNNTFEDGSTEKIFSESGSAPYYDYTANKISDPFISTSIRISSTVMGFNLLCIHDAYYKSRNEELTNMSVQIIARNRYAVEDYIDVTEEIKRSIISKEYLGNGNFKPLIIIQAGFNDLYFRNKTVANFKENLKLLAQRLIAETDENSPNGEVVLTIPHIPTTTSLSTVEPRINYNSAIVDLANELGIHYVDLSALNMTSTNYFSDGFHPNISGHLKIANKYIEDLGLLSSIDNISTSYEYRLPIRGL